MHEVHMRYTWELYMGYTWELYMGYTWELYMGTWEVFNIIGRLH